MYMHAHTLYGAIRPFGVSVMLASFEGDKPELYMIEPAGVSYVSLNSCLLNNFLNSFIEAN